MGPDGAGLTFPTILSAPGTAGFFGPNLMLQNVPEPGAISFISVILSALVLRKKFQR